MQAKNAIVVLTLKVRWRKWRKVKVYNLKILFELGITIGLLKYNIKSYNAKVNRYLNLNSHGPCNNKNCTSLYMLKLGDALTSAPENSQQEAKRFWNKWVSTTRFDVAQRRPEACTKRFIATVIRLRIRNRTHDRNCVGLPSSHDQKIFRVVFGPISVDRNQLPVGIISMRTWSSMTSFAPDSRFRDIKTENKEKSFCRGYFGDFIN